MELTKEAIVARLNTFLSDEKRIEWLEKISERPLDKETKKFVFILIAKLYEKKQMFNSALNYYSMASSLVEKFKEAIPLALKIAQLYVRLFNFSYAEDYLRKALSFASSKEQGKIKEAYFNFYLEEAKAYEARKRYRKAIKFYEYLANKDINKLEMLNKIAELYDKAAMPLEASKIKQQIKAIEEKARQEAIEKERQKLEESRADRMV